MAAESFWELKQAMCRLEAENARYPFRSRGDISSQEGDAVEDAKRTVAYFGEKSVQLIELELRRNEDFWIGVLGKIGKPAVPVLMRHLWLRKELPELGRWYSDARNAIPALVAVMDDESKAEDAAAYIKYIGLPLPDAVPALLGFAADAEHRLRQKLAITLLGEMGKAAQPAVSALGEILAQTKDPATVKIIIFSLGQIGGKESVAVLREHSPVGKIIDFNVIDALGATGDESALPLLRDQLLGGGDFAALPAFKHFGEEALPYLLPLLKSNNSNTREFGAKAIANLKAAGSAITELCDALGDPYDQVQFAAVEALGKIGPAARACIPALLKMIDDCCSACGAFERGPSLTLARISVGNPDDAKQAVEALVSVLRNSCREDQDDAAKGLIVLWQHAESALEALRKIVEENPEPKGDVTAESVIRVIEEPWRFRETIDRFTTSP